ncbi:hypothetical protein D1007_00617 [Hordeum vulgare]|nr:hypothetical protein D1007_00617 [Hordeum vulgare]
MGCGGTEEAIRPLLARIDALLLREPKRRSPSVFSFILSVTVATPVATSLPKPPSPMVMASGSSSKKGSSHGAWLGSGICDGHIEALRHHRMLPPASLVMVRIPDVETARTLRDGEIVMVDEHSYRGFGLPTSTFFSNWLVFFGLHTQHLAPNAILQLCAFIVLCEGFLGTRA